MMKYQEINARYTALVASYLATGYTINTSSMSGSQGEIASIDLTNGTDIYRIQLQESNRCISPYGIRALELIVGRSTDNVKPNTCNYNQTIWTNNLEIISTASFYRIAERRDGEKLYGTKEEAMAAEDIRYKRYLLKAKTGPRSLEMTPKAIEIAKRIIKKNLHLSRINGANIHIARIRMGYMVQYNNRTISVR
ncbi:hypothetical protein RFF05_06960 [Bengtsoniella intestinalis]|uniref:hypothetical protein n=1 Tax=Bengtsoniella intestinalis TaxID=3073143 RepID=UPI00391F92C2